MVAVMSADFVVMDSFDCFLLSFTGDILYLFENRKEE